MNFLFHGLEFLTTDSILITGTVDSKSVEIVVDESGVNVVYDDVNTGTMNWKELKEGGNADA